LIYVRIEAIASNPEKKRQLLNNRTYEPCSVMYDIMNTCAYTSERTEDLEIGNLEDQITLKMSTETFHKIIDEVFDNALKFSNTGTKIKVETWLDGDMLFITIQDRGRGMSKEQINNVGDYIHFERTIYEQYRDYATHSVGLGLVIAKRLVELHDGEFIIESEEGLGTKITMSFHYL
jgi:signal transduction histidine kinase